MLIFLVFGRIFIAHAWFWLFNHFDKFKNLSTSSNINHIRIGNQIQNLSKCTINLLENFHHLLLSSYLLVTLHLPWSLAVGGSSNVDKMSSTHPNPIPSVAMSSMFRGKDMRKTPFWYFWFDRLWPFNFQFSYRPKSSNHNILVFAHPIWKIKIVLESYWSRESMVRNPFFYFECFTSGNPCDSSTSPRANFWPMTPEKFLRHFQFFT